MKIFNSDIFRKAIKILKCFKEGNKVLFLKKSFYGLKKVGRCWNTKLGEILNNFGAKETNADSCLHFINHLITLQKSKFVMVLSLHTFYFAY